MNHLVGFRSSLSAVALCLPILVPTDIIYNRLIRVDNSQLTVCV